MYCLQVDRTNKKLKVKLQQSDVGIYRICTGWTFDKSSPVFQI